MTIECLTYSRTLLLCLQNNTEAMTIIVPIELQALGGSVAVIAGIVTLRGNHTGNDRGPVPVHTTNRKQPGNKICTYVPGRLYLVRKQYPQCYTVLPRVKTGSTLLLVPTYYFYIKAI